MFKTSVIKPTFSLIILITILSCDIFNENNKQLEEDCELITSQNLENCESDNSDYNYCMIDINPNSCTYGEDIGKSIFSNQVTVHYFGHQS